MFKFVYPLEAVEQLTQPVEVVYVIQGESKTRCVSRHQRNHVLEHRASCRTRMRRTGTSW